jgi:hypothetical protein
MDHSDHYTPQGINSVIGLSFQNVTPDAVVCIQNCGPLCSTTSSTMSSRMYAVWDWDGSMSGKGVPTILGSNSNWWNVDNSCSFSSITHLWSCPWEFDRWKIGSNVAVKTFDRTIAYLELHVGGGLMDGCDYSKFASCTDQYAPYTVGKVTQWSNSASNSILLGPWVGVSGISNTGWYWRVQAPEYGIDGAPSTFDIQPFYQMAAGSFVVLAIAYPANTKFTVTLDYWGNALPSTPMAASLQSVLSPTEFVLPSNQQNCAYSDWWNWWYMCANSGTPGFQWYFDKSHLYLRIVPYNCYNRNDYERDKCFTDYFEAYGVKVWNVNAGFTLTVKAVCTGCAIQSSFGGVNYYSVTDKAPSASFQTQLRTSSPSTSSTQNPSYKITNKPTQNSFVSCSSTKATSILPTKVPSFYSSLFPSSLTPSKSPTSNPSVMSSFNPSYLPSIKPSIATTSSPSSFVPSSLSPTIATSNPPIISSPSIAPSKLVIVNSLAIPFGSSEIIKVVGMGDSSSLPSILRRNSSNCPFLQNNLFIFNNLYPLLINGSNVVISKSVKIVNRSFPYLP